MEDLVVRAQKGDKDAFCSLIKEIQISLYKIAKAKLNNEDDIEDAVQETIISSYQHIKGLKHPEYFKTWIIRILINKCYHVYNMKKNHVTTEYYENMNMYEETKIDEINNNIYFESLMQQLNDNERIAITLYYVENFTNKEIGKILDEKEGTIKSRISRAKQKLKKILEEVYDE